jgi:hypothetical protein
MARGSVAALRPTVARVRNTSQVTFSAKIKVHVRAGTAYLIEFLL